jgi:hypothetical protein
MANASRRLYIGLGCYVGATALSAAAGLSFSAHMLNVAVVIGALIAVGALALSVFRIRPRWAGILGGCLAFCGWALLLLYFGGVALFNGNSAVTVRLDNGALCRETVYGFVTGDSGEELEVYKRYLFIDYRLHHQIHSDVYPNTAKPMSAEMTKVVAGCQSRINAVRAAASRSQSSST